MGQKSAEIAESCESWRDNRVQGGPLLAGPALDAKPGVGAASILSNRLVCTRAYTCTGLFCRATADVPVAWSGL